VKTLVSCRIALAGFASLAMAGSAMAGQNAAPVKAAPSIVYTCPGGEVVSARYPDATTAVIEYRGQKHTLKTAPSADGARYVGDGLQWWTKGMTSGMISALPPGETYAVPGAACTAQAG
jgi:membrane-bound inhibitor of C-type lysozyme